MASHSRRSLGVLMFCPKLWGGAAVERRARVEIRALRRAGHRVTVVTDMPADAVADAWPDVASPAPHVASPPGVLARFTAGKLVSFFVASLRALSGASWPSIDVVVSHTPVSVVAAWPWCRRHRVRLVYVCHVPPVADHDELPSEGTRPRLPTRLLSGTADRVALRVADIVVCPSEAARAWFADVRATKPTVRLPNPVDTARFSPDPSVIKDVDVLFVGRLSPEKGPAVLVRATALLDEPRQVVLIGEGRERPLLERLAGETSSDVLLAGWVGNDDLPGWYRRARVVAVPSYMESMGVSAAEALVCGTPVVASGVGGLLDVVHDGENGWLVPPGDAEALAAALDDALRPGGVDALHFGALEWGEERFAEEWVELLER